MSTDNLTVTIVMEPPRPHPLAPLLPGWRWLGDPTRDTVVLLAPSGFWVECHTAFLASVGPCEGEAIARAFRSAVSSGATGRHIVEMTKHADDTLSARVVPWLQ